VISIHLTARMDPARRIADDIVDVVIVTTAISRFSFLDKARDRRLAVDGIAIPA
jgi:hypothetical protein